MSKPDKRRNLIVSVMGLIVAMVPGTSKAQGMAFSIVHVKPPTPESRQIEVIASVVDEQEIPVKGLTAVNFAFEVDGAPMEEFTVLPMADTSEGIAVLLAIDVSGSMRGRPIEEARAAATHFVDQMGVNDVCAIMTFGTSTREVSGFTSDRAGIKQAIAGIAAADPLTYLYQAFYDGAAKARTAPLMRRAVVILTDGKDEGSPITLDDAIDAVTRYGVPIYPLAFGDQVETGPLGRIASLSHGRFLHTPEVSELTELYSIVQEQLKNQYLIVLPVAELVAGEHRLTGTLLYQGLSVEADGLFVSPQIAEAAEMPEAETAPATEEETGKQSLWDRSSPVVRWVIWFVLLVLLVAIIYQILKGRRAAAVATTCNWCGQPLEEGDELYCRRCAPHAGKAAGGESGLPPEPIPPVSPESLVWLDIVEGPEDVPVGDRIWLGEGTVTLGRGSSHDIDLRDDEVSRPHAQISLDPKGHYVIEDLGSTNKTFVNEHTTQRSTLRNGDRIRVGQTELIFDDHRQ